MEAITKFSNSNCQAVKAAMNDAMKAVCDQLGLEIEYGRGTYIDTEYRFKITFRTKNIVNIGAKPLGSNEVVANDPIETFAKSLGFNAKNGSKFMIYGKEYTLVGVKPSRWKFPFSGVGPAGGKYKFTVDQVKNGLVMNGVGQF